MKTKLIFVLAMLACTVSSFATTRFVSSQGAGAHTTISSAITAAVSGDTILIGPGTYVEAIFWTGKRLVFIGAGWDQTIVNLAGSVWNIVTGCNGTILEGMLLDGGTGNYTVQSQSDSITIRRCYLRGGFDHVRVVNTGRSVTVEDCILLMTAANGAPHVTLPANNAPTVFRGCLFVQPQGVTNGFGFTGGVTSGTLEIYNCVFLNQRTLFNLNAAAGAVIAVNNLFYDWSASSPTFGTYNAGSVFDYNAGPASPAVPGTNVLPLPSDPFVNYDEAVNVNPLASDFHLHATNGAAFINTGHPSVLDFTDGSRSDFGVYGGPKPLVDNGIPNWPWAVNVASSPNLVGVGTPVNASATLRIGPTY